MILRPNREADAMGFCFTQSEHYLPHFQTHLHMSSTFEHTLLTSRGSNIKCSVHKPKVSSPCGSEHNRADVLSGRQCTVRSGHPNGGDAKLLHAWS